MRENDLFLQFLM